MVSHRSFINDDDNTVSKLSVHQQDVLQSVEMLVIRRLQIVVQKWPSQAVCIVDSQTCFLAPFLLEERSGRQ